MNAQRARKEMAQVTQTSALETVRWSTRCPIYLRKIPITHYRNCDNYSLFFYNVLSKM